MSPFSKSLEKAKINECEYIVIGASSGGIEALKVILSHLPLKSRYKIAIVLHIPSTGLNLLDKILMEVCHWPIDEAIPGEQIKGKSITLAAPDYHLSLDHDNTFSLSNEEPHNYSRPSIDILFESAAYSYKEKVVGILLTGANADGALGLKMIRDFGGITIVQNPETATSSPMPLAALELITPDEILDLNQIKEFLHLLTSGVTHA